MSDFKKRESPPSYEAPTMELVIEKPTLPANSRLLLNGVPRFKISTVDRNHAITEVFDLQTNTVIAKLKRRSWFPDQVKFANRFGGKPIKQEEWMLPIQSNDSA